MKPIRVALIGLGYWGSNLARVLVNSDQFNLRFVVDPKEELFLRNKNLNQEVKYLSQVEHLPLDEIDCVFIATPTSTHFDLARYFLENSKHVWLEKPATGSTLFATQLIDLANRQKVKCFVDHTFLFSDSVNRIRTDFKNSSFGNLLHIDSNRSNLGRFQADTSALYDLAIHDLAIIDFILDGAEVDYVSNHSFNPFNDQFSSVSILTLKYHQGFGANIRVNWISPVKRRDFFIIGEKKSALYDETSSDHKLTYYDQEFFVQDGPRVAPMGSRDLRVTFRKGDICIPHIENREPLIEGTKQFIKTIETNLNHACELKNVLKLLRVLECADLSAAQDGEMVKV